MGDKRIICRDCGEQFNFNVSEQEFYNSKNLHEPTRCRSCRNKRKEWNKDR